MGEESLRCTDFYHQDYNTQFSLCVFFFIFVSPRMQTSTYLHSLRAMVSLPWVSSMTVLTLGLDWEQKTTGMLKTGGKGKRHHGNDMVPGSRGVVMVLDDKQGGMKEFPL